MTGLASTSRAIWSISRASSSRPPPGASSMSKNFPCRTSATERCPRPFSAPRMVWPCGSRTVRLKETKTRAFIYLLYLITCRGALIEVVLVLHCDGLSHYYGRRYANQRRCLGGEAGSEPVGDRLRIWLTERW